MHDASAPNNVLVRLDGGQRFTICIIIAEA